MEQVKKIVKRKAHQIIIMEDHQEEEMMEAVEALVILAIQVTVEIAKMMVTAKSKLDSDILS